MRQVRCSAATMDGERQADFEIVCSLHLHGIPLALAFCAGAFREIRDFLTRKWPL